ncbi:MAG: S8 family serine peptidase, partial [Betaproteobacteria bacterium]|nr:S8 family serine peptidase [Betaproteobacteria bacterium]
MKSLLFRTALAFAASLLALSSPCAAERALLANPAGATLAAASAGDRALAGKLARLRTIAQESGSTRLIIGIRAAFAPEGWLAGSQALTQRIDIGNAQAAVLQRLADAHGGNKPATRFETIPFLALEATSAEFDTLASDSNVLSIEEDVLRRTTLAESSPLIGATASSAAGHDGSGQVVAILDTGVDKTHTFLSGKVVSEACYSSNYAPYSSSTVCPGGATESTAAGSGVNCGADCDHGTHVAGIVAGSGASFSGVARGANLIAVQVFSRFNSTTYCGGEVSCVLSYTSDLIKGLERVYALRGDYSIASVNMSLGDGRYYDQAACDSDNSSTKAVIDNLRVAGIATVISSGNSGYTDSMGAPGCISTAISVGSTWDAAGLSAGFLSCSEAGSTVNKVACYSNSASFLSLLAPGSAINSSIPGGAYSVYHGTSMAAPQVAGAWAVLKQAAPGITVSSALNTFSSTGVPVSDYRNAIVKPRIDLVAALASLSPQATYTLMVNSSGAAGVAIGASSPTYAGTTNYSKAGIAAGTSITLTAPPTAGSTTFTAWSGCDSASGVTCTVTMNAPKSVTATFAAAA